MTPAPPANPIKTGMVCTQARDTPPTIPFILRVKAGITVTNGLGPNTLMGALRSL